METLNPENYLETQGVSKNAYAAFKDKLISLDLTALLEGYHKAKLAELDLKITPEDTLEAKIITMNTVVDGYPG